MLSGTISNHAFGDEYILHFEEFLCDDADFQITKDLQVVVPGADEKKLKGQVVHETEILVQSGSRFFTKTVVGKTTTTIRGELKPLPEPGRFQLEFNREVTEASGHFLQTDDGSLIDIAPKTVFRINRPVELGKPYSMLKSEKGAWILGSIRLKPEKSPN
jgi:hypothetical protein